MSGTTASVGLLLCACMVVAKVNFCAENHLPEANSSSGLQFTKELSTWEYAVDSKFKSLHCCAKGYLSIEWFKDGRPYPWPGDVSSFILYPESANQTVYTNKLRTSDAGIYTCKIHNYTDVHHHNTELKVFDQANGYMETPLATYKPPEETLAPIGSVTRLFCEAFVGHIDLPDATSEVKWGKKGNTTFEAPHIEVTQVQRENEIVGKYLIINNVDTSDFGTYYCTISNTGDQKIVMETVLKPLNDDVSSCPGYCHLSLIFIIISTPIVFILAYYVLKSIINQRFWGKMNEYNPFKQNNSKKVGVVVLYHEYDHDFVEGNLRSTANADGSVYLFLQKLKHDVPIAEETINLCSRIGKMVIVMSKNLSPIWTLPAIQETLDKIIIPDKIVSLILLEELPEPMTFPKMVMVNYTDPLLWSKLKKSYSIPIKKVRSTQNRLSLTSLTGNRIVEVHV